MSTKDPRGDRSGYSSTESLKKKPPIPKKPVGLGQTDHAHESFAKIRATFDHMPNESMAKPLPAARKRDIQTVPSHETFVKIRDAFNQLPDGTLARKPPVARKRAGFHPMPKARLPSSPPNYPAPPPIPPSPTFEDDGGYDTDTTVYLDPWSPAFPIELPVRTPTEAEMKAARSQRFPFNTPQIDESPMFPPRFQYDPEQFFTTKTRIRSQPNFEFRLDTPSPPPRPPPPIPPRRKPPVPAPRTKFPPRDTVEDLADDSQATNPFAKPGPTDAYVGSNLVVGLTAKTFKTFIKDVDAAFVLFYDPGDDDGSWAKLGLKKAAQVTKKENHVYAAVDCTKERELCRKQKVLSVPTMKLFVKGITVDTYGNVPLLPVEIRKFVENAPVVSPNVLPRNRCNVQ